MRRRHNTPVPDELTGRIAHALARVEAARARLARVAATGTPLPVRRSAHAELRAAYESADSLLRQAVRCAGQHSYPEWSQWRTRLSRLDAARQAQLFAEADDLGVLGVGAIRAIDTGMSGPAIGDLLHGESSAPGASARYGLDVEALLVGPVDRGRPAHRVEHVAGETGEGRQAAPPREATVVALPLERDGSPLEAA